MNQNFETLYNKEWILIGAPSRRKIKKTLFHKRKKFTGDECSLQWGKLLLGEPDGNVYMEIIQSLLMIHAPEGKYYFQEYNPPNFFKWIGDKNAKTKKRDDFSQ